ncbi:hypothetical protein N7G274_006606 [Stereocaulon virgatum]|uniref:Capsid protein n=1 Tax=Stereocaulon virgatum TaxID=373712 RepID=A0ABR4A3Z6_9LECA
MSSRSSKGKGVVAGGSGKGDGGGKGGGPSKGPRAPLNNIANVQPMLSFYVRITPLAPDYSERGPRQSRGQRYWEPPNRVNDFMPGDDPSLLFRWMGGRLSAVPTDDNVCGVNLTKYCTATVFTQRPDTPHLLAVPFDASSRDVNTVGINWRPLTFDHEQVGDTNTYLSYVTSSGAEQHLAAHGSQHWIGQLLPAWYDCDTGTEESTRIQGGLIGELPLLFALAAFSAPPSRLSVLTNSLQPGAWVPHQYQYPSGHVSQRGMVVTIYFDPRNPVHSTKTLLDKLERGDFGPFYGP